MRQRIYSGENISGPRERLIPADCEICRGISEIQCPECGDAVCYECMVECDNCRDHEPMCLQCFAKRGGLRLVDDTWVCEDCQPEESAALEEESDLEHARR